MSQLSLPRWVEWLTRPSPALTSDVERYQARMLASIALLVLFIVLMFAPVLLVIAPIDRTKTVPPYYFAGSALLLAAYFLGRSRHYHYGVLLVIVTQSLLALSVTYFYPSIHIFSPAALSFSIFVASIFWNETRILITSIICLAALTISIRLFVAVPDIQEHAAALAFVIVMAGANILWRYYRHGLERLRIREVQNQEERYRDLFENTPVSLSRSTPEGKFLETNKAFLKLTGYASLAELDKIKASDLYVNPAQRKELMKVLTEFSVVEHFEMECRRKDGQTIWIEANIRASRDAQNKVLYYETAAVDITLRKTFEQALRDAELFTRSIIDSVDAGLIVYDQDLRYRIWNPYMEKLTGLEAEKVLGRQALMRFPRLAKHGVDEILADALSGKTGVIAEREFVVAETGFRGWVSTTYSPQIGANGEVMGVIAVIHDITERKLMEDALRDSEGRLRTYFDTGLVGITISDPDGTWLEINDRLCSILGYTREELIGRRWQDITHPEDLDISLAIHERVLSGELDSYVLEKRYLKKDGETVHVVLSSNVIREPDGAVDYFVVTVQDVTRSREAEREIRYQAQLLNTVDQAVIATDMDGLITYWNPAAEKMYGWSVTEAVGRNIMETTVTDSPELLEQAAEIMAAVLEAKSWYGEYLVRRKDGTTFPAIVHNAPIYDHKGQIAGVVGTSLDITERKQAEEAYRALVDHSLQALIIIQDGEVVFVNNAVEDITGYTPEEYQALSSEELQKVVHPDDRERVWGYDRARIEGREAPDRYEWRLLRKDGAVRWVEMLATGIEYRGRPAAHGALIDITERKLAEEQQRASSRKLAQAHQAAKIASWEWDLVTGGLTWSDEMFLLFGVDRETFVPTAEAYASFVHPDDVSDVMSEEAFAASVAQDTFELEYRIVDQDTQDTKTVHLWADVDRDDDGNPIGMVGILQDITDRKKTETALHESEEKLKAQFHSIPVPTYTWQSVGDDFVLIDYNDTAVDFTSGAIEEQKGRTASDMYSDSPEVVAAIRRCFATKETIQGEMLYQLRSTGDERYFNVKYAYVPPNMVLVHTDDITERRNAEVALRESETRFRTMANSVPILIWMSGTDKLCTYFNDPWLTYTGRTIEQELGNGWAEGVHPDDLARCVQTYEEAFDAREPFSMTYRLRQADGSYGWIQDDGAPRYTSDGTFLGYIGGCVDLSERVEAEEALRQSEARFRNFFDLDLMGASITSPDKKYVTVNKKLCDILGYPREELMALSWLDVTHPEDQPADVERMQKLIDGEVDEYFATKRYIRKDGEIVHVSVIGRPVYDPDGNVDHLVALIEDITPRVKARAELLESTQRLEIMNRIMFKITSGLAIDEIVDAILVELRQSFPAYRATYMTVLPSGEFSVDRTYEPGAMPSLEGLSGSVSSDDPYIRALAQGDPVTASDVSTDPHFVNLQDAMETGKTAAVLDVPLKLGGDLIGVLSFDAKETHLWTDHEITLLKDMSRILELALQNAREEQRRKVAEAAEHEQRMFAEALQAIGATLAGTLDEEEVLTRIEESVRELVPHETFAVMLIDGTRVYYRRSHGYAEADDPELRGEVGFRLRETRNLREAYETQVPTIVNDSRSYEGWVELPVTNTLISCLAAPIHVNDEVIGFITLGHSKAYFFTDTHAQRLQAFADQAGLAIHNAQRFEAERRDRLEAETLRLTAEALATTVTLDDTLRQIMGLLERLVDFRWAMILLVDNSDLQIESIYGLEGGDSLVGQRYDIGAMPLFREALMLGGMQIPEDNDIVEQIPWPEGVARIPGTTISLPLVASEVVIGLLLIGRDGGRFDSDDVLAITTFGQQAAIAIRNAHIVQELEVSLTDLQQAQAHLRRVERLNAAGELAAGVAHQINNPLTVVIGQVHVLMQNLSTEHPHYNSLDIIRRAAYRAGNIVQRILNLTRDRAYTTNLIDINFSINSAVALIRGQLELHTMRLSLKLADDLPPIVGSAEHLEDVWLNLMLNARDAVMQTESHGTIRLETAFDDGKDQIVIRFNNDGPPIPPEKIEHIFTPFYTTKEDGTGLGLSVCYDVITRHNGMISVTSAEEKGTTFTITLPVATQEEQERIGS